MATFQKNLGGFRYVDTRYGETLQSLALRELGNASHWVDIAVLNGLRPPYIVDDPALVEAGVALSGEPLRVPAPSQRVSTATDPSQVFGVDLQVVGGRLSVSNGDLALTSNGENFVQALKHRLKVDKRELSFHPEYGCWVRKLIGKGNGPTSGRLAAFYTRSSLLEDDRVKSVPRCVATISGDSIEVVADVVPISGRPVTISTVI